MSDTDQGGGDSQPTPTFSGRDAIARALQVQQQNNQRPIMAQPMPTSGGPRPQQPGPTLSPEEEQQIFGGSSDQFADQLRGSVPEEHLWSQQFHQQVPPPIPATHALNPNQTADPEHMPTRTGDADTERIKTFSQPMPFEQPQSPPPSTGFADQMAPSFGDQWSGGDFEL